MCNRGQENFNELAFNVSLTAALRLALSFTAPCWLKSGTVVQRPMGSRTLLQLGPSPHRTVIPPLSKKNLSLKSFKTLIILTFFYNLRRCRRINLNVSF